MSRITISVFKRLENIVVKEQNDILFSLFLSMFSEAFLLRLVNPLPNHKFLDRSKLKALADDIVNGT